MTETAISRPSMSEAEAWSHTMTRAILCDADAEHAIKLADQAAASVREAHAIADLFQFLEAPAASDAKEDANG